MSVDNQPISMEAQVNDLLRSNSYDLFERSASEVAPVSDDDSIKRRSSIRVHDLEPPQIKEKA